MDLTTLRQIHLKLDELEGVAWLAREAAEPEARAQHEAALVAGLAAALALAPAYPAVYAFHAEILARAGELAGAAAVCAAGASATGDVDLALRRTTILRGLGDEVGAQAALEALVADPASVADPRAHWQLAAAELDRGDAMRCWERLSEYLVPRPIASAEDLARTLPLLLLRIECARVLGRRMDPAAVVRRFVGVDADLLAAAPGLQARDNAAPGRVREALRGDPYHPWGHYVLAAHHAWAGDVEAALAALETAIRGEPALAWRARHDRAFAGLRAGGLAAPDAGAAARCEPWVAQAEPEVRPYLAYLPLRTGAEEAAQRAWWPLPGRVRGFLTLLGPDADGPEADGHGADGHEAGIGGGWALRLYMTGDRIYTDYAELHRGLRALAPYVASGRLFVKDMHAPWIDEITVADGRLRLRRDTLSDDEYRTRLGYFARRAKLAPDDAGLARLAAVLLREAARHSLEQFTWKQTHPGRSGDAASPVRRGLDLGASQILFTPPSADSLARETETRLALALRLAPGDAPTWALRGRFEAARGDLTAAREAFVRALALDARQAVAHVGLAELEGAAGSLAAAVEHLEVAAALPDRPVDVYHRLGLALQRLREYPRAIAAYERSIALQPELSAGTRLNLGQCLAALGRWDEALACHDAALAEAPEHAPAWVGRGQALRRLGRRVEAEAALRKALELDDSPHLVWLELAGLRFADPAQALALCDEALRRRKDCAYTWSTRGSALNNLGRRAEALACYDRAIELDPRLGQPWCWRACTLALEGRVDEALVAARRAVELDPSLRATLAGEPDLAGVRDDPGFAALLRG